MENKAHLILGDCLFADHSELLGNDGRKQIIMIEDYGLCTHYRYHKHKLVFFLASMREHAKSLKKVHALYYYYLENEGEELDGRSFEEKLDQHFSTHSGIETLRCYEIDDRFFESRIIDWAKSRDINIEWVESPKFLFSQRDFQNYLAEVRKPFLKTYYERQRKALRILIDKKAKPEGGSWSYDSENRKKLPKSTISPAALSFPGDTLLQEVKAMVNRHFPEHPGNTEHFRWAWTRKQALAVLDQFVNEKLELFGPYEDAFEAQLKFGFHSTLSPYLNNGLLQPEEVLEKVLECYQSQNIHLPSVEGFVRQLLGWREFIRGMYRNYNFEGNHFQLNRKLTKHWYDASTGIPPLDDCIQKVNEEAYNHHIERLMVLGNLMLLCEIHPQEVYRWFMEMYIDSADWVMVPNVLGMSQFADGGIFATKPYIAGSNYLRKMSHYPKGDWCDVVDGLYWRFIDNHRETFAQNPRMSMMLGTLNKMNPERRKLIFSAAKEFIEKVTV